MKILLVIPPFTQINTPYPSVTQLAGFLKENNHQPLSLDLSIKVFLRIFSFAGLEKVFSKITSARLDENSLRLYSLKDLYITNVDKVIEFLQGKNPNLAYVLGQDGFLPQGESFSAEVDELKSFGELGIQDKAKYYCSMFIDDVAKFITKNVDSNFGLSRYAEKISVSLPNIDPLLKEIENSNSIVTEFIEEGFQKYLDNFNPDVIAFSVPFPGNLLAALLAAKYVKQNYTDKKIILGGGYINTELRKLKDYKIFDFIDFITYDDGELPLLKILENLKSDSSTPEWIRTLSPDNNIFPDLNDVKNIKHNELPAPDLTGIDPNEYISMSEMLNPMHRLWSDGYWNKLTAAHGCYWHKCSFCDTSLDYIKRYSPAKAKTIVDWMEKLIAESGRNSFHFTDEAAPPVLLREVAIEIMNRNLKVSWWGNIRYEKNFTPDLCKLLALSGCVAVSGGIEVADDRLLKLINKGVTVKQAAQVCANFIEAGIMTHAYLMFGFPTQIEQEIINSLEIVRQLTETGLITSAFWHRFSLTCHSPVYENLEKFKIKLLNKPENNFANNDLRHSDVTQLNYEKYSFGLNKALYNFMHGLCFDWNSHEWFDFKMPKTTIKKSLVKNILINRESTLDQNVKRVFWYGGTPVVIQNKKTATVIIHSANAAGEWETDFKTSGWIKKHFTQKGELDINILAETFPEDFSQFTQSEIWSDLRELGLICL
ncbi:MAG: radical SAM protein [Rhodothermaceae bacterium]